MHKDTLVFAGKQVGLELVAYLLSIDAPIGRMIVARVNFRHLYGLSSAQPS